MISPKLLEKADQDTDPELGSSEMELLPHLCTDWAERTVKSEVSNYLAVQVEAAHFSF